MRKIRNLVSLHIDHSLVYKNCHFRNQVSSVPRNEWNRYISQENLLNQAAIKKFAKYKNNILQQLKGVIHHDV